MEIPFALLCGYTSVEPDGRLHIKDGDIDVYQTPVPGPLPAPLYIALKLLFRADECERHQTVRVEFGPEGEAPLVARDYGLRPKAPPAGQGWQKIVVALKLSDVVLPREGEYAVRLLAGGRVVHTLRLRVEGPPP